MKKTLFAILVLLVLTLDCRAQISLVQTPGLFASVPSATSVSQSFTSNTTAGDLIVVFVATPLGVAPTSVTGTSGCTYQQVGASDINLATVFECASAPGGAETVTAHTGSATNILLSIVEYKGHLVSHPVGNGNANNSSAVQPFGTIASPVIGSLVVNLWTTNGVPNPWTSFSGCTPHTPVANAVAVWSDAIVGSPGLNTCSAFQGTGGGLPDWIGKTVTFLPANYVPPAIPAYLRQTEGGIGSPTIKSITGVSPAADTFAGGNQFRNKILVAIEQYATTTDQVTAVTDTAGDTFSRLAGAQVADDTNHIFYSFWIATALGGTANNTASVAFSSGNIAMAATELSGTNGVLDTFATGTSIYTITAAAANELLLTINGYSGGGKIWSGLSGTDLFFGTTISSPMEWNYLLSALGSNSITSNIAPNFAGSLTVALQGIQLGCSMGGSASLGGTASLQ